MITFERILDEIENSMTTKADLAKCPPFNNRGSRFILNDSMDGIEQSAPPTSRYAETYAKESTHAEAAETRCHLSHQVSSSPRFLWRSLLHATPHIGSASCVVTPHVAGIQT